MLSENNLISPPLLLFVREVAENLIYPEFFGGGGGGDQGVGRMLWGGGGTRAHPTTKGRGTIHLYPGLRFHPGAETSSKAAGPHRPPPD